MKEVNGEHKYSQGYVIYNVAIHYTDHTFISSHLLCGLVVVIPAKDEWGSNGQWPEIAPDLI